MTDEHSAFPNPDTSSVLREYLYVDTSMVRGILAQLESGIDETATVEDSAQKEFQVGLRNLISASRDWGDSQRTSRSLAEFHFPYLEYVLEEHGFLHDYSHILESEANLPKEPLESILPAGSIVRITAPGHLMDARFMASLLTGFSTTARGLTNMGMFSDQGGSGTSGTQKKHPADKRKNNNKGYKKLPGEDEDLEGAIPLGLFNLSGSEKISGEFLRGIIQVLRGMYAPGLHLMMNPKAAQAGTISVRLQDGRQYLDTDPDILFSRYGVSEQEWTVAGVIGHHAEHTAELGEPDFVRPDQSLDRSQFAKFVTQLGAIMGSAGLTDISQAPGFTVVPWAVYRNLALPQPKAT